MFESGCLSSGSVSRVAPAAAGLVWTAGPPRPIASLHIHHSEDEAWSRHRFVGGSCLGNAAHQLEPEDRSVPVSAGADLETGTVAGSSVGPLPAELLEGGVRFGITARRGGIDRAGNTRNVKP